MTSLSALQNYRLNYKPTVPSILEPISLLQMTKTESQSLNNSIKLLFPKTADQQIIRFTKTSVKNNFSSLRVGVVFSGGQAPGGHNVICGLFDTLKKMHSKSELFGFLEGPEGIINNKYIPLNETLLKNYRNQGGFDLIGSGRTKIESAEQFESVAITVKNLDLDGLIIIGGDDSNTNAAFLAEYFLQKDIKTKVIGVPKTIDGDLKNEYVDISFGFDTASKIYSEMIGNVARDALSAKKYYFFIKLMGRSASHITLECALKTHVNMAFISEEVAEKKQSLNSIVTEMADMICTRSTQGKDYGVILIPEGLIEFIPELNQSISDLNLELDSHGNVQVSKIETERLLIDLVKKELDNRTKKGIYKGKFSPQPLFFGYEGRSGLPSNFDCNYCYSLGILSAFLVHSGLTGYMSCISKLSLPTEKWELAAVPICQMLHTENRAGQKKTVIKKALVDLGAASFNQFEKSRQKWLIEDDYQCPGPIQFEGPKEIIDSYPLILNSENETDAC